MVGWDFTVIDYPDGRGRQFSLTPDGGVKVQLVIVSDEPDDSIPDLWPADLSQLVAGGQPNQ